MDIEGRLSETWVVVWFLRCRDRFGTWRGVVETQGAIVFVRRLSKVRVGRRNRLTRGELPQSHDE